MKYKFLRSIRRGCIYIAVDLNENYDIEAMVFGHQEIGMLLWSCWWRLKICLILDTRFQITQAHWLLQYIHINQTFHHYWTIQVLSRLLYFELHNAREFKKIKNSWHLSHLLYLRSLMSEIPSMYSRVNYMLDIHKL